MKYFVTFKTEECKGCELCIEWCPKKLIAFEPEKLNRSGIHPAYITDQEACVGCGNCGLMCPDAVITIEKRDE